MKVYYNSSLWGKEKGFCGLPQKVNWQFEYLGTKCCIPAIYRFPKGIVFDIITFLDEGKLLEFFERYKNIEGKLTPMQHRCAEQEHPYQALPIKGIWINGKRVNSGYSSSGDVSIPWARNNDKLSSIQKAYSTILNERDSFACERYCIPYPETDSKTQKILRFLRFGRVNSIKLSTHAIHRFYPLDIQFKMSPKYNQKVVSFKHPVTKIIHTLYFQNAKLVEMPLGRDKNRSFYAMQSMYEIDPALPRGDTLQFNSSMQYTESSEDKFRPMAAASIGIIGGADGPTAVFVAGKNKEKTVTEGLNGFPLHSCFSVPTFYKEHISQFVLEGINVKYYGEKEYNFK